VFRLSGTGSSGATVRVYLEKFEKDASRFGEAAPAALRALAERALDLVQMSKITGRDAPTVIT
jgi:phosphoglucomutase